MTVLEFNRQLVSLEKNLFRFASRLTSDRNEAEDLLQDTMVKAIVYRDQFTSFTNLKAWTFTIMKNSFINNYRRNVRHVAALDGTKNLFFINSNQQVNDLTPDSFYAAQEISKLIDSLDNSSKIPFKMLLEGYKYKDISQKLGIKLGTVKSRIFLARKRLMDLLDENSF